MYFLILLLFMIDYVSAKSSWTEYKAIVEGPYHSIDNEGDHQLIYVRRRTRIRCMDNTVELDTSRWLLNIPRYTLWTYKKNSGFGVCTDSCNEKRVEVSLTYENDFWSSTWSTMFEYVNKNCDKLYGSSVKGSKSCTDPSRDECADCDGHEFSFRKYCQGKDTEMESSGGSEAYFYLSSKIATALPPTKTTLQPQYYDPFINPTIKQEANAELFQTQFTSYQQHTSEPTTADKNYIQLIKSTLNPNQDHAIATAINKSNSPVTKNESNNKLISTSSATQNHEFKEATKVTRSNKKTSTFTSTSLSQDDYSKENVSEIPNERTETTLYTATKFSTNTTILQSSLKWNKHSTETADIFIDPPSGTSIINVATGSKFTTDSPITNEGESRENSQNTLYSTIVLKESADSTNTILICLGALVLALVIFIILFVVVKKFLYNKPASQESTDAEANKISMQTVQTKSSEK